MSFLGNKTQRMHPLYVPVANKVDYFFYTAFRRINPFSVIALALLIYSLVGFVGDIRSLFSDSVWDRVLYIAALILSGVVKVLNLATHYEDRFTTDEIDKDFFKDVDVPNGDWQRLDLRMGDKETEPVFFSEKIDKLLRSDTPIDIRRDKEYEKRLGTHIRKKENWEATYSKFLRHNHRKAMYSGKQFYNEAKYGLSSDPTPSADPTKPVEAVKIHKTCYFDSYLTNIIPGQVLTRNRDKEVMASALEAGWLPFTAEGEERRLRATGECAMANEPGVTTLCIKENDTIILWRQNHLAQCSTGSWWPAAADRPTGAIAGNICMIRTKTACARPCGGAWSESFGRNPWACGASATGNFTRIWTPASPAISDGSKRAARRNSWA